MGQTDVKECVVIEWLNVSSRLKGVILAFEYGEDNNKKTVDPLKKQKRKGDSGPSTQ